MPPTADFFGQSQFRATRPSFWERIASDDALAGCDPLEKLLIGCQVIAALDAAELLAA